MSTTVIVTINPMGSSTKARVACHRCHVPVNRWPGCICPMCTFRPRGALVGWNRQRWTPGRPGEARPGPLALQAASGEGDPEGEACHPILWIKRKGCGVLRP
ncbi:hypothetical protein GCM10017687_11890 [Streptomyces echinatus]